MIQSLPLSHLGELLRYAEREERRREREELEKRLFPLWLANYTLGKMNGLEVMDFGDFLASALDPEDQSQSVTTERTAEEIMKDFSPVIEADRAKGG